MMDEEKIIKAGKIASKIREKWKKKIKRGMKLVEIAEGIEKDILSMGGKPAFPVNIGIDEVAAHYTPAFDDDSLARGLIKVDFGVSLEGWLSDTAFSLDLDNCPKNKKLIETAEKALEAAINLANPSSKLGEIGKTIQKTINQAGFVPISNLTGHSIERYELHAGKVIPNLDNKSPEEMGEGVFAIEPFVTDGRGKVYDGPFSEIYRLVSTKAVRGTLSRKILKFIKENYNTLPFCSRWIINKFGTKAKFYLHQLELNGNLHRYHQLIESSHSKVAQAEHTFLLTSEKKIVTTR